jgi:hypothetical protein
MRAWITIAREPAVVRRALRIALIVGTLLIAINHGDALLRGDIGVLRLAQMMLTVMVPYCVSTVSIVGVLREIRHDATR